MTDINLTEIALIVDESGSMISIKDDTEGGFNTFIEEQKKVEGKATVSLTRFENASRVEYSNKPIDRVKPLVLRPGGGTALLDAIGDTIDAVGGRISELPEEERPGSVIVVILTDGQENSSRRFTKAQIKQKIKHQSEKYNWVFVYLGANQDAIAEGGSYGIPQATSITYSGQNVGSAFTSTASNISTYRGAVATASAGPGMATMDSLASYTDEQRAEAVEEEETTSV